MNLFKLKKDGKAVGYLHFAKYLEEEMEVQNSRDGVDWVSGDTLDFDEACPYVCLDKNGDKVFAGDNVKSGKRILKVVWDVESMQWKARQASGSAAAKYYLPDTPLSQWAISEQFELIKEQV